MRFQLSKEQIKNLHLAAQQYLNKNQLKQAHAACIQILQTDPRHADAHFLLAMIALNMQQMTKAIELNKAAINLAPNNPEYYAFLARSYSLVNRYPEARKAVNQAMSFSTDSAIVNDTLGVVLSRLGEHDKAVPLFAKAIAKQPNNPNYYYNLAASQKFMGNFDDAETNYEKVIQLKANYYPAHSALAELQTASVEKNHVQRLKSELNKAVDNVDGQLHLCHALGKELECLHEYKQALHYLMQGNAAKKNQLGYNIKQDEKMFADMRALFSSDFVKQVHTGCLSRKPIFVLGMPRSGTTLVDRILSSHSQVTSAGELQNFAVELKKQSKTQSRQVLDNETILKAATLDFAKLGETYLESTLPVSNQTSHFIDKMPLNFLYIGLIKKALPQAKIILLDRHPMDVCISNFRTLFAVNFSYYNYAYDLLDTGHYYGLFKELMAFWQSIYGDELLQVSYEALVENPENNIRKILNYCELEWQDQCLNFHTNPAPVSTASSVQVRKPMNTKSIGRWQQYGDEVQALEQLLSAKGLL